MPETDNVKAMTRAGRPAYSFEQFKAAYDLPLDYAKDLFNRFGPSKPDLDALMNAINNRNSVKDWL